MSKELEEKVKQCHQCQATRHSPPLASSPMGIAPATDGLCARQLCWTLPRGTVPNLNRCPLYVDRSSCNGLSDVHSYHREAQDHVCNIWTSRHLSFRQWDSIYNTGVQVFLKQTGIRHICIAPCHPATNGQAERAVHVFEEGMKRISPCTLETRRARFLFHYRTTPHIGGVTAAQYRC